MGAPEFSTSDGRFTVIIGDAPDQEVYVIGKSVIVQQERKGLCSRSEANVTIERFGIEGDVATIGGNGHSEKRRVIFGGDVIAVGGPINPRTKNALREHGKQIR
jgi:hypothetical protein